jgi:small-conductance mechanosensitive channel
MHKRKVADMKRRVKALQRQMAEVGPVMRGSVVLIGTRNKQFYFSLNKDKKTHLIYLGHKRLPRARQYSANYRKLLEIVEEMTILNMKVLKEAPGL